MSNTAVGAIYKKIIDAVLEASRTDFEEYGVANDVLLALQEDWQSRLSDSKRAAFPWDPQLEPVPPAPILKHEPIVHNSSVPSPVPNQSHNGTNGTVQIKQEPTYDASFLNLPQTPPYTSGISQPQYAHQRAAHLLQKQFGNQATGSIGAIQAAQMGLPGAQQRPQAYQQLQLPQQLPQPGKQEGSYIKQESGQESLGLAQNDGAGDSPSMGASIGVTFRNGIMRQHVEAMAQRLEAGGALVPLDERRPTVRAPIIITVPRAEAGPSNMQCPSRYDGPDDDEDEDAINSDLDDPEEEDLGNTDGDADYQGDVILCLYDKVQRVKNKWKCTLKDGVVTVEGKDYVFHKAQGEFEW